MSLTENYNKETWEISADSQEDDKSFSEYLFEKAKDISDNWQPHGKRYESEESARVVFGEASPKLKIYIKAFAIEQHDFIGNEIKTVRAEVSNIYVFLKTLPNPDKLCIDTSMEKHFEAYIKKLQSSAKNIVDKKKKSLKVKTVRGYAISVLKFITFLNYYSDLHRWSIGHNVTTELPKKLSKYFSNKELQIFKNELVTLQSENQTKSISWATMYDIMKFVEAQPPSYIKTAIVVMANAGLRISEVRELKIDCLEKVSEIEQLAVFRHFKRIGKLAPMKLDYSDSYWLKYYIVKNKEGVLESGTPILVGKAVKKAIDETIELTAELRYEAGSDMLFLNKGCKKGITIREYGVFLADRDKLVEKGMPFLRFHQLRATFATILHRLNVPVDIIEKYMNHVSSDVTSRYINSQRNESMSLLNKVLDGGISGTNNDEKRGEFSEELLLAIESNKFAGLSHSSQIKMFERLMRKHDIKLSVGDHGTCVLVGNKTCPNGYEGVNPCHTAECKSFNPDVDDETKQFFILSLARAENKEAELKKFADEHGSVQVNYEPIHRAQRSLAGILQQIGSV